MSRVLHAGFHKTGSTFLQKRIFPHFEGVAYLGNFSLADAASFSPESILLFSCEASCGYPYPIAKKFSIDILKMNARVLQIDKCIILEREFYSWVLSLYFQTLNERCFWSLDRFLEVNAENLLSWRGAADEVASWCEENDLDVLIIDYQKLRDVPEKVVTKIADFIGCEAGKIPDEKHNASRYGYTTINVYRFLNILCRSNLFYGLLRLMNLSSRKLIAGRLGWILEKFSIRKLTPYDVEQIIR